MVVIQGVEEGEYNFIILNHHINILLQYLSGGRDNIRIHIMSFFVMVKRNDQFLPDFCS